MLTMCLCQRVRNLTPRVCVRGYEMLTHVCVSEGKKCYPTCVCQRIRNVTPSVCVSEGKKCWFFEKVWISNK